MCSLTETRWCVASGARDKATGRRLRPRGKPLAPSPRASPQMSFQTRDLRCVPTLHSAKP